MAFAGKSDFTTWFSSFLGTGAIAKDPTNGVYLILASEGATYGTQVGHLATSVCACSAHDVTQVGGR